MREAPRAKICIAEVKEVNAFVGDVMDGTKNEPRAVARDATRVPWQVGSAVQSINIHAVARCRRYLGFLGFWVFFRPYVPQAGQESHIIY